MWERVREIWLRFSRARVGTHASSIAFYFFLSTVPLIIVYACLVPGRTISAQDMVTFLSGIVPDALSGFMASMVTQAYAKSGVALSLSIVVLLWTVAQSAQALRRGLNAVYEVKENRNAATAIGVSVLFIVVLLIALSMVMYLIFSGGVISAIVGIIAAEETQATVTALLESLAMLAIGVLVFAACYTYLAAGSRPFRAQLPGAVLVSVVWYVFSFALRWFLCHFNRFTLFYGSLAMPVLFVFWLYCIFYILLAGGFINHVCANWIERKLCVRS